MKMFNITCPLLFSGNTFNADLILLYYDNLLSDNNTNLNFSVTYAHLIFYRTV